MQDCTGDIETCPRDECGTCAERDCPSGDSLHYHHDGCPSCPCACTWSECLHPSHRTDVVRNVRSMRWRGSTLYLQGGGDDRARGFKNAKTIVVEKRAGAAFPSAYEFNYDGGRVRAELPSPTATGEEP